MFFSTIAKHARLLFMIIMFLTFVQCLRIEKAFSNVKFNNEEPQSKMRWNGANQESDLNKETKSKHEVPSTVCHK